MSIATKIPQSSPKLPDNSLLQRVTRISFNKFRLFLLLILGLQLFLMLLDLPHYFPAVGDNIYPESAGVMAAYGWARGLPIYQDYRHFPYLMTAFPPLWYLLIGMGAKLGISSLNGLTMFGRAFSLLSLSGVALVGYRWNRAQHISPRLAIFAPLLFLSFPILVPWAVTARPDLPALLPSFLAVFLAGTRRSGKWIIVASVASAIGFLMRHNSVAAPVAIVLWLLWQKRWRHAAMFCLGWGVLVGATFGYYQSASNGLFLLNIGGAKFGGMALTYVRDIVSGLTTTPGYAFAVILFAFGVFGSIELLKHSDKTSQLILLYATVAMFFALLGSAAAGAAGNHFIESALATATLAPLGFVRLEMSWDRDSLMPVLLIIILSAVLLPSLDARRSAMKHNRPEDLRSVAALVSDMDVFSDIPYVAARGKRPQLIDLASLTNTERAGGKAAWHSSTLVEDLNTGKYDLVVLSTPIEQSILPNPNSRYPRYPRINEPIQKAVEHGYRYCFELRNSFVYVPLGAPSPAGQSCPAPMVQKWH
jgi:hypothetical protein